MGWTVPWSTRTKEQLLELLRREVGSGRKIIKESVVGNHRWSVEEYERDGKTIRYIRLDLLAYFRDVGAWGYKDLCESMGPAEVDCPLSFFDLVPLPDGNYAEAWRQSVRDYHRSRAQRRNLARVGLEVEYGDATFRLEENLGRRGWIVTHLGQGRRYRMTAPQIGQALRKLVRKVAASGPATAEEQTAPVTVVEPQQQALFHAS